MNKQSDMQRRRAASLARRAPSPAAKSPNAKSQNAKSQNEGEGNRTAAREYNRQGREFVRSGQVKPAAREAEHAIDTDEAEELRQAELIGRRPARY